VCKAGATGVIGYLKDEKTLKAIEGAIGLYCVTGMGFGKSTCSSIIRAYKDSYFSSAFTVVLKSDFICGTAFNVCTAPTKMSVASFATAKLADKPATSADNTVL
jgi:hypothetical protein